ncbi:hypothetical protein AGMMS4956_00070 [Bacteroidia bacterium]|nr:hypothetical protein AGMMS4956_00070 [Bacteroidia bacterium]
MNKTFKTIVLSGAAALMFASCEKDKTSNALASDEHYKNILTQYVDGTVLPTYKALAEAALEMRTANAALRNNPTDAAMQAASDAWMKARVEWEKSEAFLFGPVGEDGFDIDGHIDSWPLELQQIQASIAGGESATGAVMWREYDSEVIGFHVTEYLLYRDGQARSAADLTPAELNYLTAATDALVWDCVLAYVAWAGEDNVSAAMKTVFRENADVAAELDNKAAFKNFAAALKNATGKYAGNFVAAISEISDGAADIAGEVGATKIESPFTSGRVEDVESWYSWHSLDDYQNNILSIRNAYFGGVGLTAPAGNSLSAFVAAKNAALDTNIKAQIADCLAKIAAIGAGGKSFYEVVRDHDREEAVSAAVDACAELERMFKQVSSNVIE